jgi:adenine phosphoribosyltransferase
VFAQNLNLQDTHYFGGIESRGFILATLMSAKFKKGFIPIRKAGKLPPPVFQESYDLEYGSATLEAQPGQGNIIILDDVLATGGTLQASIKVCQSAGYKVLEVGTLINLKNLNQFLFNDQKPFSILEY